MRGKSNKNEVKVHLSHRVFGRANGQAIAPGGAGGEAPTLLTPSVLLVTYWYSQADRSSFQRPPPSKQESILK